MQACFNTIVNTLINDTGFNFKNYVPITSTTNYEAIITDVNTHTKQITLDIQLPFIIGPLTIYNAISCDILYAPVQGGDPLTFKHFREATIMFQNKTFTNATISFSSDILPKFIPIPIIGMGNGIFGKDKFGQNYFGGNSHSAPFRTYIPASCQRCRYLNVLFHHQIAREQFAIYGISITDNGTASTRGYR